MLERIDEKSGNLTIIAYAGNKLEGDVSNVVALDQPASLFSPRKATRMSP